MNIYEAMQELNPNTENFILTVLDGEHVGEKALLENHHMISMYSPDANASAPNDMDKSKFFIERQTEIERIRESGIVTIDNIRIYAELLGQEKKLVVLGAGHVSGAVIMMARMIGMRVTCIEDRETFAEHARRAGAERVICEDFEAALDKLDTDMDTSFVIVTRGHQYDMACLRKIIEKPNAYIGMMGSKRRVHMIKEKLCEEGCSREKLEMVHTPIGLSIGAETPEEIAVSIMAEIIEEKNKRKRNFGYPKEMLDAIVAQLESERLSGAGMDATAGNVNQVVGNAGGLVVATIVTRSGSAPREVGTKMLIRKDESCIGTIGGGSVEGQTLTEAADIMKSGEKTKIFRFDMSNEDAAKEGMICGGVLDILLELI